MGGQKLTRSGFRWHRNWSSLKIFFRIRFRIDINWTDDLSHSCLHGYFTPNFTFAFVILKGINSEIMLFRFALFSVTMVNGVSERDFRKTNFANQAAKDRSQISWSGPKRFGEGAKGLCGKRNKRLVALAQHGVARMQTLFAPAQVLWGDSRSLGPKDLLHPLQGNFQSSVLNFPLSMAVWFARQICLFRGWGEDCLQNARFLWAKSCAKPLPEDLGDEILHFYPHPQREKLGEFLVENFLSYFPKENRLKICHSQTFRKFHHIFHCKERNLSPGARSGGGFT